MVLGIANIFAIFPVRLQESQSFYDVFNSLRQWIDTGTAFSLLCNKFLRKEASTAFPAGDCIWNKQYHLDHRGHFALKKNNRGESQEYSLRSSTN